MKKYLILAFSFFSIYTFAQDLEVYVVDVGNGMANIAKLPSGKFLIFDAGHWNDKPVKYAMENIVGEGGEVEWLILSHTDADHWGYAKEMVEEYQVKNVLWTNYRSEKLSGTTEDGLKAIRDASGIDTINLSVTPNAFSPGDVIFEEGEIKLTFLCGFGNLPDDWNSLDGSKKTNGVSIVVRLDYGESSIMFPGDAVGRKGGESQTASCIATEEFLLDNLSNEQLDVDVMIAPHHGADNGSCMEFIEKTSPDYVIFSAGRGHGHPKEATAIRYMCNMNYDLDRLFRTDREDYESKYATKSSMYSREWGEGSKKGNKDKAYDDDIVVRMKSSGEISVKYENF